MSSRYRQLLSWGATAALAVFVVAALIVDQGPAEDRAQALGDRIRCPVCQGESIADSPSDTARAMMDLVRDRIAEGHSDEEIIDELVSSYSGSILLDPPASGSTLLLWLLPVGAVVVGAMIVGSRVRTPLRQPSPPTQERQGWKRATVGGLILIAAASITIAVVGQNRQTRADDTTTIDPDTVSNETLEAVIAANLDDPAILGMRLALANRYFEDGNYMAAFPHYEAVIGGDPTPLQAGAALTRLAWMVYDGNGETDIALGLFDRALEAVPEDPFTLYLKGRVHWCGEGDTTTAITLFERVLGADGLDADVRSQVASDLAAAERGEACP